MTAAACSTCRSLRRKNRRLAEANAKLKAEIVALRERLAAAQRTAKRQAAPFSKGSPTSTPKRPGRRAGPNYGPKAWRPIPDHVDEVLDVPLPAVCPDCGGPIEHIGVKPQFQCELPEIRPHVARFDVHVGHCGRCRRSIRGRHIRQNSEARGAAASHLGPRAMAVAAELNKGLGLSYGKVCALFESVFHLRISRGGLCQAVDRVGQRLLPTYTSLSLQLQRAPMVVPDETGWKVGGVLKWLWVFVSSEVTVYAIFEGRGFEQASAVLSEEFSGALVRDGWAPYRKFQNALHQTCLGHLLRRCHEEIEAAPRWAAFPRVVRRLLLRGLDLRDRRDRGEFGPHGLRVAVGRLRADMDRLLACKPFDEQNRRLLRHLGTERAALFTFLEHPGVDATNWRAEQAIRPAVVTRKVWGGNRTWNGALTQAAVQSFLATARQQRRCATTLLLPILCSPEPQAAALHGVGPATPPFR